MSLFAFDDMYAMFDVTPVENQFVLEYLPEASGDYVKVYLYGLTQCYHPVDGMNVDQMTHDLGMTEDEVLKAFRYWERRGLVRRVSDNPPSYQYLNIKQRNMAGKTVVDNAFENFTEDIYSALGKDRRVHGGEIADCYEWVEDLGIPPEVVIMLLKHLSAIKGKNFSFKAAQPYAARLAKEKIRTIEAAEKFLSEDRQMSDGAKKILYRLGKRRFPSDDETALYRKWVREWGFTHGAVEEACTQTVKGEPNFGYLDAILKAMAPEQPDGRERDERDVRERVKHTSGLKTMLRTLGSGSVNDTTLALYDDMLAIYPQDVILTAARECALKNLAPEDVAKMLASWKAKGLSRKEDVDAYIASFKAKTELLRELRGRLGLDRRESARDRKLIDKWLKELGFSSEALLHAADYATDKEKPMLYLDRVLGSFAEQGVRTPDEMDRAHKTFSEKAGRASEKRVTGKHVLAQEYTQREYKNDDSDLDREMERWKAEHPDE